MWVIVCYFVGSVNKPHDANGVENGCCHALFGADKGSRTICKQTKKRPPALPLH